MIQTIGRAARNSEGHVIMYADMMTDSMKRAISETNRRRKIQDAYNKEHGIIPKTIQKSIRDLITNEVTEDKPVVDAEKDIESKKELKAMIDKLTKKMNMAAADLNFEMAAIVRDELKKYKEALRDYDK